MKKGLFLVISILILGLVFAGCSEISKISTPATVNTGDDLYKCIPHCDGPETATGMGQRIIKKKNDGGTWFMYNKYDEGDVNGGDGEWQEWEEWIYVYTIVAGNPKNGANPIGTYWIYPVPPEEAGGPGWYRANYYINPDVFVVVDEHLSIDNDIKKMDFTAKPGKDDNQDFKVPFYDDDGKFYIFAHFAVDCAGAD